MNFPVNQKTQDFPLYHLCGQTDRQTNKQTDKQTNKQTNRNLGKKSVAQWKQAARPGEAGLAAINFFQIMTFLVDKYKIPCKNQRYKIS